MDFKRYAEVFNSGDDARLVEEQFTEDCVFQSGGRTVVGRAQLLEFLHWAHDGIREIMRPQVVLESEQHLFAEIDMDFHATRDRPDFLFGPLQSGECLTVKFFVLYTLRDGKVAYLKAGSWPANVGVSTPTVRLGGTLEERQAYREYTRAFSNADFERFGAYYTDDVVCELARMELRGKHALLEFYREMFKSVRESLTVNHFVADDGGIAADITSQFTALADAPAFVVAPLRKGEFVRLRVLVYYTLRDGKIAHIKVGRVGEVSAAQRL
ncbi:MAG TPA: nuclear transport factor 2 family protein [Steroidobacteraceae bacterium]|nr:nuclear transport factor 2 family protein [Steroidobacteraceae bacterium]